MSEILFGALSALSQIVHAGNAITAFSLLLYSLTFNLKERVARAFALLLACVSVVYVGDVLASANLQTAAVEMWLRLQWIGISFVPAAFLHLSDALLASTGRPSRGRRRLMVFVSYLAGGVALWIAATTDLVAGESITVGSVTYLRPGTWFPLFFVFFFGCLGLAGLNFWRAYQRCLTVSSRRRMAYLMLGSGGPLLGAFPFLMLAGGQVVQRWPTLFLVSLVLINLVVAILMVLMAYAVAYFGVSYPDRVVKARLSQWILRGPVVASSVLAVTMIVERFGNFIGAESNYAVPLATVGSILLLQYVITLVRPTIETWLFDGVDRGDVTRLQLLQQRLITTGDLRQFFEAILNAACDVCQSSSAFIAAVGAQGLELEVSVGPDDPLRGSEDLPPLLMTDRRATYDGLGSVFNWDQYWIIPIHSPDSNELTGLLGLRANGVHPDFSPEEIAALSLLNERAAVALSNRHLQREVFGVVDRLMPEVEAIQRMRAAARFAGVDALSGSVEGSQFETDLINMVRGALAHYWGGPRLTRSPLLRLRVVREALDEHGNNPVNALRAILKRGIENVRPEGTRRFTPDWMLYNILEMKFMEGRKVRDIAMRLAMSEADLYRKQRVAIEAVARSIRDMEREASSAVE